VFKSVLPKEQYRELKFNLRYNAAFHVYSVILPTSEASYADRVAALDVVESLQRGQHKVVRNLFMPAVMLIRATLTASLKASVSLSLGRKMLPGLPEASAERIETRVAELKIGWMTKPRPLGLSDKMHVVTYFLGRGDVARARKWLEVSYPAELDDNAKSKEAFADFLDVTSRMNGSSTDGPGAALLDMRKDVVDVRAGVVAMMDGALGSEARTSLSNGQCGTWLDVAHRHYAGLGCAKKFPDSPWRGKALEISSGILSYRTLLNDEKTIFFRVHFWDPVFELLGDSVNVDAAPPKEEIPLEKALAVLTLLGCMKSEKHGAWLDYVYRGSESSCDLDKLAKAFTAGIRQVGSLLERVDVSTEEGLQLEPLLSSAALLMKGLREQDPDQELSWDLMVELTEMPEDAEHILLDLLERGRDLEPVGAGREDILMMRQLAAEKGEEFRG